CSRGARRSGRRAPRRPCRCSTAGPTRPGWRRPRGGGTWPARRTRARSRPRSAKGAAPLRGAAPLKPRRPARAPGGRAPRQGYDRSVARYKEGIDPYLATLDAQRTLYAAQRNLTATRLDEAQNLAALYASIGGPPA